MRMGVEWRFAVGVFFRDARHVLKWDSIGKEILGIALPAALGVAADPLASLIDTAFIGHIGAVELAAAGVSIALFNQASRLTIFPLVSITTSFVAEEDTLANMARSDCEKADKKEKPHIASASTALILGVILGLLQAIVLIFMARPLLGVMGVKQDSAMMGPAEKYLVTRAFGAPAVLVTLAMQGIFRGFKDTRTPLYVIVCGYSLNVALDPILIFVCGMGIRGPALAHVLSQYLMALTLFLILITKLNLMPPTLKHLQFARFLKNGFYLLTRVIAVTFCVTLAASLAARLGPTPMAAFQTCLQVWLTSSLLADGLAIAIQAILACAFTQNDYHKATAAATRVLQMSFLLGIALSLLVGLGLYFGAPIFSTDIHVLHLIRIGLPFVAATQPINSLSFVFDGVNFGASDFVYSAYSLVLVAIASVGALIFLSKTHGFVGLWIALTIYMTLRAFAGIWRMGTGTGPWTFLREPRSVQTNVI